jgi:hypothetical protein
MWKSFAKWGIPEEVISCYRKFYSENTHKLQVRGKMYESVRVDSGVRQGCPLSPLLFVLCIEPFLCELARKFPDATIKAFADDIAMVSPIIKTRWHEIFRTF